MTNERLAALIESARRHLALFTEVTYPKYHRTEMHDIYSGVLNRFASGQIRKLIISMPPQHGKTELSSRRLPAFMLGKDPDLRIALASYSQTFARKIGRDIRRIMTDGKYRAIFPDTKLAGPADKGYTNSSDEAEIVGHHGSIVLAGRGAGLTGMPVDVLILDDLYKNAEEANSPIIRESVIDWYKTVADTRLHNNSQQLIVFTRWHQEDLVGWLEANSEVRDVKTVSDLDNADPDIWLRLNLPAIKVGPQYELDPRKDGEPLWPERHSKARLVAKREQDPETFGSMYQGDPKPLKGLLYSSGFQTYDELPEIITERWAYGDTADQGADYLCVMCAVADKAGTVYVTDVLYTADSAEVTEPLTAKMLMESGVSTAWIESNSGGRSYARNVTRLIEQTGRRSPVQWFSQTKNKEARILTNAAVIMQNVRMPNDWVKRWPQFAEHILGFKKVFRANSHDDAPDALTGLYEKHDSQTARVRPANVSARRLGL